MTTSAREEQVVRDFLAPLSTIEPVRRPSRPSEPEPGPARHYLRYAAIAVAAALLVAAIAVIAHPRKAEKPAKHRTDTGIFSKTHGWITLGGLPIIALNPADPKQTRVLSRSPGDPIAWSRDGSQFLVTGPRGFGVLHADRSWTRLDRGSASGGSFTPDGSHVIYAENGTIWSVPSNGGKREAIARGRIGQVYGMPGLTGDQLSPDGRTLVYTPEGMTPQTIAIALMNSDGSNQRQLVSIPRVVKLMGYPDWRHSGIDEMFAVAWLGNSSQVLFLAANKDSTRCALFAVNTDGSDLRRWGPRGLCPARAALSPDGSRLAFTVNIHHRDGLLITNDLGDVTQTILFPHNEAHPILAWQP
jgi:hypothetical protein